MINGQIYTSIITPTTQSALQHKIAFSHIHTLLATMQSEAITIHAHLHTDDIASGAVWDWGSWATASPADLTLCSYFSAAHDASESPSHSVKLSSVPQLTHLIFFGLVNVKRAYWLHFYMWLRPLPVAPFGSTGQRTTIFFVHSVTVWVDGAAAGACLPTSFCELR